MLASFVLWISAFFGVFLGKRWTTGQVSSAGQLAFAIAVAIVLDRRGNPGRHSVLIASSTLSRPARKAGHRAARMPTAPASTRNTSNPVHGMSRTSMP
jgi:hypothetical protein